MGLVKTFKLINITFLVYKYPQGQNLKLDPEVLYCQALYLNIKHPPTKHNLDCPRNTGSWANLTIKRLNFSYLIVLTNPICIIKKNYNLPAGVYDSTEQETAPGTFFLLHPLVTLTMWTILMSSSDGDEINRIKKKEEIWIVEERRDKIINFNLTDP